VLASLPNFLFNGFGQHRLNAVLTAERVMLQSQTKSSMQVENNAQTDALKPAWVLPCSGIEKLLTQAQKKSSTKQNLCVTLSSDFVRYAVLPAQTMLTNAAEKKAYAHAALRDIYGAVADEWVISLDDVPLHQHTLVAAIDRNLLEKLQQIATAHQVNLQHVYPYLTVVSKQLQRQVGNSTGFLVIVEPQRLVVLGLLKGAYQTIRTLPIGDDWQTTLQQFLTRESLLQAGATEQQLAVLVYAPAHATASLKSVAHYRVQRISIVGPPLTTSKDPSVAMLEAVA
jgi:hypothetical protein